MYAFAVCFAVCRVWNVQSQKYLPFSQHACTLPQSQKKRRMHRRFFGFSVFLFLIIYARCPHKAAGKTQSAAAAGRGGRDPCSYPIGDPGSPSRVPGTGGRPFFRRRSLRRAGFAAQTLAGRIRFPFALRTTRSGRAGSGNPALPCGCAARRLCTEKSLPCPAPNPMPALFHTVRGPHARAGGALRRWVGRYAKADIRHTRPLF